MSFSPVHSRSPVRRGPSPAGAEDDRSNINTIFVGNLAPDSDERSLRDFFGKYGYVTQVKVILGCVLCLQVLVSPVCSSTVLIYLCASGQLGK